MPKSLSHLLTLARVPNIPTVWTNILMAWCLAGGRTDASLALALAGGTLLYAGGCTLNDAFDARWDARHKSDRLIPSGALSARSVWLIGGVEMAAGLACFASVSTAAGWWALALAGAILLYDFRHKETPWSVVVMGACRALLVLTAARAAGGGMSAPVVIAAVVLWAWIIALSLLARRESRPGGGLLRALRPGWSVGRWVGEMLAAITLVDAALVLALGSGAARFVTAGVCVALWPVCRWLQRKFAAT